MSGRDIRDVCQQAERSWASKVIFFFSISTLSRSVQGYVIFYYEVIEYKIVII